MYLVGDYIIGLAVLFLYLPFLVTLRTLLGRAEGEPQIWSRVAFLGGVFAAILAAAAGTAWGALAFGIDNLDDESVRTLMYLDVYAFNFLTMAFAVLVLASSAVILRTGVLWRWLGVLGIIVGVLGALTPLSILNDDSEDIFDLAGFVVFIGLALWFLFTGIAMLMKKEEPMPATPRTM
jgi:hypothetical protein